MGASRGFCLAGQELRLSPDEWGECRGDRRFETVALVLRKNSECRRTVRWCQSHTDTSGIGGTFELSGAELIWYYLNLDDPDVSSITYYLGTGRDS